MSLNPISDVKGYGEQDFPLSERAQAMPTSLGPLAIAQCRYPHN